LRTRLKKGERILSLELAGQRVAHALALARLAAAPEPVEILHAPKGRAPPKPRWYVKGEEPWNAFDRGRYTSWRAKLVCPLCGARDSQSPRAYWHKECDALWSVAHHQGLARFAKLDMVCALTGAVIDPARDWWEVDHATPLFHVKRLLDEDVRGRWRRAWTYWSIFNLRPVLGEAHQRKSAAEMRGRFADLRQNTN
jgi:hypothetical protein